MLLTCAFSPDHGPGNRLAAEPRSVGTARSLLSLSLGSQAYEIPAVAVPYFGRGLDPSLFELSALSSKESGGRLPVQISYRGKLPALPGVTITRPGRKTALGFLTAASARVFGAALDRQYQADHHRASYGTDGLFASGVSIGLAGKAATPPAAHHDFPMHTLTVHGMDLAGQPDTGDAVFVFNVDNTKLIGLAQAQNVFAKGVAKYSVPSGHYFAVGLFGNQPYIVGTASPDDTAAPAGRIVVLPQFKVSGNSSVTIAERAATSKLAMLTPRPAAAAVGEFLVQRGGQSGPTIGAGLLAAGGSIWVSPTTSRPTVGALHAYAFQQLASPSRPDDAYAYSLGYQDPPGIISPQRYEVGQSDLATVDERYYQDRASGGSWTIPTGESAAGIGMAIGADAPVDLPGRLVQYLGGNIPSAAWLDGYSVLSMAGDLEGGQLAAGPSLYPAGKRVTATWNDYPLHPDANTALAVVPGILTMASASRSGNTLTLDTTPFSDNQLGHTGTGFLSLGGATVAGSYQVDQNGKKIAGGNAARLASAEGTADFNLQLKLSPSPSTVKFQLDASRIGPEFRLSTASQTTWTWRSAFVPSGVRLPPGWACEINQATFTVTYNCAVQPMMTLRYDVHGMGLDGAAPAGRQVVGITVGHLQLAHAARVATVRVAVSFDGGKHWHAASVSLRSSGECMAVFNAPAGALVTLRTSAADAAGGAVTETIASAYQVAG